VYKDEYPDSDIVSVGDGTGIRRDKLNELVFQAIETDNYEQLLFEREKDEGTLRAWALIDRNTNRVYAVKGMAKNKYACSIGYFAVPLYDRRSSFTSLFHSLCVK
jgi:hypothetical protein